MDSEPPSTYLPRIVLPILALLASVSWAMAPGTAIPPGAPEATPPGLGGVIGFAVATLLAMAMFAVQSALGGLGRLEVAEDELPRWRGMPALDDAQAVARLESSARTATLFFRVIALALLGSSGAQWGGAPPWAGALGACGLGIAVHFTLLEAAGRALALNHLEAVLRWVGPPARLLAAPFLPLALVLDPPRASDLGGGGDAPAGDPLRERELALLPHVEGVDRVIEEEAVDMMDSVREFREKTAEDIMTPRIEIEGIEAGAPREEVHRVFRETPYSRLIVYRQNLDHIEGFLLAKEVLLNPSRDPFEMMRQPVFVEASTPLPELLERFRSERSHLAVVSDEFGGTAGIATLHDLLEKIVGGHLEDVQDDEDLWIEQIDGDHALLSGRVELWEINEELDLDLDEDVARTLGGYLMYRFARLPSVGDRWTVDKGHFLVRRMDGNRIDEVGFERDESAREAPLGAEEHAS